MTGEPVDDAEARADAIFDDYARRRQAAWREFKWMTLLFFAAIVFVVLALVFRSVPLLVWAVLLGAFTALPMYVQVATLPPYADDKHPPVTGEPDNWATRLDAKVRPYMNLITIAGILIGIALAIVAMAAAE